MTDLVTTISDERLAEMLAEVEDLQQEALNDAEADQNPQLAVDAVGEFALSEMRSILTELQSLRAQGGVRVEEDGDTERHIDELRLRAFQTNSPADMGAYYAACSKWFQDRHFRRMALSSLEASPAPVSEEKMWRSGTAMKGTDPSLIHPDNKGHRTRFSDASTFDEICVLCGATDGRGDKRLDKPCPNTLAAKGGQ